MEATIENIGLEKYSAYKDSNAEWLDRVPEHWHLTRLGTCFNERKEKVSDKDFQPLSVTKNGILPQLDSAAKSNDGDNRKLVNAGDFVINSRSDRKGSSGVSSLDGSVSLINIVLEPLGVDPSFCNHLLKSYSFIEEYYRNGRGIVADLWTTRYSEMKTITIAIPPLEEQIRIANFLDQKTEQIDKAIAQKEKLIELLKERKQIMIQKAVTQGLNRSIPMKPSGIDLLGEVPAHWKMKKLKFILSERNERSKTGEETLLMMSQEHGLVVRADYHEKAEVAASNFGSKQVYPNDLVFNKLKAHLGVFFKSTFEGTGLVSPDYAVYKSEGVFQDMKHLELLFRHPAYIKQFIIKATGIVEGLIRLYTDDLFSIKVPVPPIEEQAEILVRVSDINEKTDKAIKFTTDQIRNLKEYKSTIIDSAVTGKIKV